MTKRIKPELHKEISQRTTEIVELPGGLFKVCEMSLEECDLVKRIGLKWVSAFETFAVSNVPALALFVHAEIMMEGSDIVLRRRDSKLDDRSDFAIEVTHDGQLAEILRHLYGYSNAHQPNVYISMDEQASHGSPSQRAYVANRGRLSPAPNVWMSLAGFNVYSPEVLDGLVPDVLRNPRRIPTMPMNHGRYVHFSPWSSKVVAILSPRYGNPVVADRLTKSLFPGGPFASRELPPEK